MALPTSAPVAPSEDRAGEWHGDEVGQEADDRDLLEARRNDRGGSYLHGQRDGQEVREQLGRVLERAQDGVLHERLQRFSEEQDAEDGGDRELEAGVVDEQGVSGEDAG